MRKSLLIPGTPDGFRLIHGREPTATELHIAAGLRARLTLAVLLRGTPWAVKR